MKTFILLITLAMILNCSTGFTDRQPSRLGADEIRKLALQIHREMLTLDAHTDTPITLLNPGFDIAVRHPYDFDGPKVDFPRMKEGGLDSLFFAIFVRQGPLDSPGYARAADHAVMMFQVIKNSLIKNQGLAGLALSPVEAKMLKSKNKISVFIGIENGHAIGENLSLIKKYFSLGARYMTLCHTGNNAICDSSTDPRGPQHNGLSRFGKDAVLEMNRTGMIIDVSHISDKSFYDVISLSKNPVIASHSNARAICSHPRNLTDDMMILLAKNGGVINASLWSGYVEIPGHNRQKAEELEALEKKYSPLHAMSMVQLQKYFSEERAIVRKYSKTKPPLSRFIDHIDHMVRIAGIDHVGIGSDFDGGGGLEGCRDVSQAMNITVELLKRGYVARDIKKIWGGNMTRLLAGVPPVEKGPE